MMQVLPNIDTPVWVWEEHGYEVNSSRIFDWSQIDYLCLHYTGVFDEDELPPYKTGVGGMRAIQRNYKNTRGYSIGYNFGMHPYQGKLIEGRGFKFRAASNSADNDNVVSLLLMVDDDNPAPQVCVERIRQLVAELRVLRPHLKVVDHQMLAPTGCAGAGIHQQVLDGVFEPVPPEPPKENEVQQLPYIKFEGALDQFMIVPVSYDSKGRIGDKDKPFIEVKGDLDELASQLNYGLTRG